MSNQSQKPWDLKTN